VASAVARSFTAAPYEYEAARAIAGELGLSEPVAVTLVRRGYGTVEQAQDFLAADELHDPFAFREMSAVCELVLAQVRMGGRITVHGDYDVDGVAATALLVSALRELGAMVDWLIPDRIADGYGLSMRGVEELIRRGTKLLITADCGIGCAEEVQAARAAGLEVVVTDHHRAPERLPECPVLHPVISGYPFAELCGTGVAHKLATALRLASGAKREERDLDLVALATVADMVPLLGENRRLVREGLLAMRMRPRPGLRALITASRTDPEALDSAAISFRLAPRINAAGRLYRADAGVELMLTDDPDRGAAIAAELDRANQERRAAEAEVLEAAERARAALPSEEREGAALVLAGERWHPGVVGIVASRLVERYWRPVVLIGLGAEGGRGSARSIPGFDLLAALQGCAGYLRAFGGHAMAAGVEIERERIGPFRRALIELSERTIDPAALVRRERIDAVVGVGADGIGLGLAEELERLAPFGQGNPEPRLLVPAARIEAVRGMGDQGRHSRFQLRSGNGRAVGVAFGVNGDLDELEDRPQDLSVELELDRWNGAVQPRIVLRERYDCGMDQVEASHGCGSHGCPDLETDWWRRFAGELERTPGALPEAVAAALAGRGPSRSLHDRRGGAAIAALVELVSSGASVLALCADASRRRGLAAEAADPRRFGAAPAAIACSRCGPSQLNSVLGGIEGPSGPAAEAGLALADWGALQLRPWGAAAYQHVVLVDPPPQAELSALAGLPLVGPAGTSSFAAGFIHLAWGPSELELARLCVGAEWELRGAVRQIWRQLEQVGGDACGEPLGRLLSGPGRHPRTPELAARCVRVLGELGLCEWSSEGEPRLRSVSSERTDLARSATYLACRAEHERRLATLSAGAPDLAAAA
jgi:single-stranded-DNA-specific exonuclease